MQKVNTTSIPDQDIIDLVITALEGGIGYWACLDNTGDEFKNAPREEAVSETTARLLLEGKEITFCDAEDENEVWHLDLQKLLKGIGIYSAETESAFDIDEIDAEVADCIFQYALFDKLVYG